jgi:hypothetical protein
VNRRELAVILIFLAVLLLLAHLWPSPAASDVPAGDSILAPSEFVAIRSAGTPRMSGQATPAPALPQPRTPSPVTDGSPSPAPSLRSRVAAVRSPVVSSSGSASMTGISSWFASPIGVSAAGPALRTALGPGWRGVVVQVTANGRQVSTKLGDWCACPRRAIDLDAPVFAALAPLSQGLMEVTISW